MTLVSETSPVSGQAQLPSLTKRLSYAVPAPSGDVLEVAAYLGGEHGEPRAYLVLPSGPGESASDFVYKLALSLVRVESKPVLLVALNDSASFDGDHTINIDEFKPGGRVPIVIARPMRNRENSELLSSQEYSTFLTRAREHFSYILIDTQPLAESVAGLLVASHCDGVILSAEKGKTRRSQAQSNLKKLQRIGARMMGFVLLEGRES